VARIKLDLPTVLPFKTQIPVRITDINYGGHLGNDALLSLIHEARVQYFASLGYSEHNVEGVGIIMTDAVLLYKAQVFQGDVLQIAIGVTDLSNTGADIVYRVTSTQTGKETARVKTRIAFFDYQRGTLVEMPGQFRSKVSAG
jgi:acyl-CoA thioester hydrolase